MYVVQPDRPQNDLDAGCYEALDWNFNFLSCVVAQPVDWLPLAAMGLSVFRGEAPILVPSQDIPPVTEGVAKA